MIDDGFRLFPVQASLHAPRVDLLYTFLILVAVVFTVLIAGFIVYFSVKYRRGNTRVDRTPGQNSIVTLEVAWMVIPFLISMVIFAWGAGLYFDASRPPVDALEVRVVAKQWMWKFQHPQGRREINTLHVPLGQPVKLTMISEDVIHSMFVPAFRMKRDVLPGSYSQCWFTATKTGEFHLFCAEYCGTNHSRMTGKVLVLSPAEYSAWLGGGQLDETPALAGKRLFAELKCANCHTAVEAVVPAPALDNVFGQKVPQANGDTVTADETYLRESILRPGAKVVKGFQPLMPSFDGQVNEEQLQQLVAYIKSLSRMEAP